MKSLSHLAIIAALGWRFSSLALEPAPSPPPTIALSDLPREAVRVEILERSNVANETAKETEGGNDSPSPKAEPDVDPSWGILPGQKTDQFNEPAFALTAITNRYNERGVKVDRSQPFLVRAAAAITLPAGEHRLLLRSLTGARFSLDGRELATTPHLKRRGGDNEPVPDQAALMRVPGVPILPPGHKEELATIEGDGQPHVLTLEAFVGGKNIRPEIGELSVAISSNGGPWEILQPKTGGSVAFEDRAWKNFGANQRERIAQLNADRRRNPGEESYWKMRHDLARQRAKPAPELPAGTASNPIDRFIDAKLEAIGVTPAPVVEDAAFLRRATLDVIGLIPTAEEISAFLADTSPDKRAATIARLLADPRWADRWVPYWQDVLAENPNMLKGTLNNTGPFRWWLYEALLDNLPMDRFVTELVSMEGSAQYGGPAGFGLATQNDLVLAAKAQIVSSAFLATEMKCARCHDAPYHPVDQADLLGLAAMLQRSPVKVPGTSLTKGLSENSQVTVSLKPGQTIDPHWPFADLPAEPLPGVLRAKSDSRELLAALLTDPRNERFAQVLANRLWQQFLGFGFVDPVEDWENASPSHSELLRWLGHELVTHDYDLKHLARLILTSLTYRRAATAEGTRVVKSRERLFESPARRRLTAEQLVDSLFVVTGLEFDTEQLTMDPECRQVANDQGNFGRPLRAWEFAALSNERDRPALAKPRAQIIGDVLAVFGWRESRAEPRSTRDHEANVLQPALLANGTLGARLTRLTDDHACTALALTDQTVGDFVQQIFLRLLSRAPSPEELGRFTALLAPGYDTRRTGLPPAPAPARNTKAVSWANHLNPEATNVVLAVEKEVQAGPPPTPQLRADWRERCEDALWALMVSPEFIAVP